MSLGRICDSSMDLHERFDLIDRPSPETAFCCDAEISDVPLGGLDSPPSSFFTVARMYETQVELRVSEAEVVKRLEVLGVVAVAGNRHVDPVHRAS